MLSGWAVFYIHRSGGGGLIDIRLLINNNIIIAPVYWEGERGSLPLISTAYSETSLQLSTDSSNKDDILYSNYIETSLKNTTELRACLWNCVLPRMSVTEKFNYIYLENLAVVCLATKHFKK